MCTCFLLQSLAIQIILFLPQISKPRTGASLCDVKNVQYEHEDLGLNLNKDI